MEAAASGASSAPSRLRREIVRAVGLGTWAQPSVRIPGSAHQAKCIITIRFSGIILAKAHRDVFFCRTLREDCFSLLHPTLLEGVRARG